jgi:hypothetical protein
MNPYKGALPTSVPWGALWASVYFRQAITSGTPIITPPGLAFFEQPDLNQGVLLPKRKKIWCFTFDMAQSIIPQSIAVHSNMGRGWPFALDWNVFVITIPLPTAGLAAQPF